MGLKKFTVALAFSASLFAAGVAKATDIEVTHWWTSGGEAAAVAEFAKAVDASGDHWVDGAISGSGDVARPIMMSRILGGNPMGATQFNPGHDADEMARAGLFLDLTDLAKQEKWADILRPKSQLASCTIDGKVYCVPVNLHSAQWLWTNRKVFTDLGLEPPKNINDLLAAAPKLKEKGIQPLALAQGWAVTLLVNDLIIAFAGTDNYVKVMKDRDLALASGPVYTDVFKKIAAVRDIVDPKAITKQWNEAVALVIQGKAAANVMGDWSGGEFQVAKMTPGKDYDCLPGLGLAPALDTGGDVFYFPKSKNADLEKAQLKMAKTLVDPKVQVAFNLKKGSLPIRPDVDLSAANDCMKKGLDILDHNPNPVPSNRQMLDGESITAIGDLLTDFFSKPEMKPEEVQAKFAEIIKNAPPLK
jgi:glucose/mannose transport system substrate-binding protein